jgi:YegS/Rv2252/BmrU family lipid kinase
MQKDDAQKLLFVINPVSGGKEKHNWEAEIRQYFKELPHNIELYLLNGKNDYVSVQHHIQSVRPDKVVAVGGDGTIKLVAELLQQTPIPIGIIPAGSANGMARELSIPLRIEEALKVVLYGHCTSIDAISINNTELCIHLSDIGLNAMLVKYFEGTKKRGMWGYAKGVFKMLWNKQKLYVTITTDKETVRRKAFMVVLANARTYGTGAVINPEGNLTDGFFEVIVMRRLNFWELLKMLVKHKTFNAEKIEVFKTKSLKINTLHRSYFQVDGEYRGRIKGIEAKICHHSLHVMLPSPGDKNVA